VEIERRKKGIGQRKKVNGTTEESKVSIVEKRR